MDSHLWITMRKFGLQLLAEVGLHVMAALHIYTKRNKEKENFQTAECVHLTG